MKILAIAMLAATLAVPAFAAQPLQIQGGQYSDRFLFTDVDGGVKTMEYAQSVVNGITAKGGGGGAPLGAVIIWTEANNPEDWENWHDCDGGNDTKMAASELCKERHICTAPDFSGRFLRQQGGLNGGAVGNKQGDAIRNIVGTQRFNWVDELYGGTGAIYTHSPTWSIDVAGGGNGGSRNRAFTFDASRVVPTTKDEPNPENRPVSYTVRYLIRINE